MRNHNAYVDIERSEIRVCFKRLLGGGYKSSGLSPVCIEIRASILGPSSSRSWNANT